MSRPSQPGRRGSSHDDPSALGPPRRVSAAPSSPRGAAGTADSNTHQNHINNSNGDSYSDPRTMRRSSTDSGTGTGGYEDRSGYGASLLSAAVFIPSGTLAGGGGGVGSGSAVSLSTGSYRQQQQQQQPRSARRASAADRSGTATTSTTTATTAAASSGRLNTVQQSPLSYPTVPATVVQRRRSDPKATAAAATSFISAQQPQRRRASSSSVTTVTDRRPASLSAADQHHHHQQRQRQRQRAASSSQSPSSPRSSAAAASPRSSGAASTAPSGRGRGRGGASPGTGVRAPMRRPLLAWREPHRVLAVAALPGGHVFTAGGPSGAIRMWDGHTGLLEAVLEGHQGAVLCLATLTAAIGGGGGHHSSSNSGGGHSYHRGGGLTGGTPAVAPAPLLLSGGVDGTARLWHLVTLKNMVIFEGHVGFVTAVASWAAAQAQQPFSSSSSSAYHDGGSGGGGFVAVFTASDDGTIRQWSAATGVCVHVFRGHQAPLNAVICTHYSGSGGGGTFSSSRASSGLTYLISAADDGAVKVWSITGTPFPSEASHRCVNTFYGGKGRVKGGGGGGNTPPDNSDGDGDGTAPSRGAQRHVGGSGGAGYNPTSHRRAAVWDLAVVLSHSKLVRKAGGGPSSPHTGNSTAAAAGIFGGDSTRGYLQYQQQQKEQQRAAYGSGSDPNNNHTNSSEGQQYQRQTEALLAAACEDGVVRLWRHWGHAKRVHVLAALASPLLTSPRRLLAYVHFLFVGGALGEVVLWDCSLTNTKNSNSNTNTDSKRKSSCSPPLAGGGRAGRSGSASGQQSPSNSYSHSSGSNSNASGPSPPSSLQLQQQRGSSSPLSPRWWGGGGGGGATSSSVAAAASGGGGAPSGILIASFILHNNCVSGLCLRNNKLTSTGFDHITSVWSVRDLLGAYAQPVCPYPVALALTGGQQQHHQQQQLYSQDLDFVRAAERSRGPTTAGSSSSIGGGGCGNINDKSNWQEEAAAAGDGPGGSVGGCGCSVSIITATEAVRLYPEISVDFVVSLLRGHATDPWSALDRLLSLAFAVCFSVLFAALYSAPDEKGGFGAAGIAGGSFGAGGGTSDQQQHRPGGMHTAGGRPQSAVYALAGLESQLANYPVALGLPQPRTFLSVTSADIFFAWANRLVEVLWLDRVEGTLAGGSDDDDDGNGGNGSRSNAGNGTASSSSSSSSMLFPTRAGGQILLSSLRLRVLRADEDGCQWNHALLTGPSSDGSGSGSGSGGSSDTAGRPCYPEWSSGRGTAATTPFLCPVSSECAGSGAGRAEDCARLRFPAATCARFSNSGSGSATPTTTAAAAAAVEGFTFSGSGSGPSFTGAVTGHYSTAGYAHDLLYTDSGASVRAQLTALSAMGFVDDVATRLVDVSLYVYSVPLDVFMFVHLVCEIPDAGAWFPSVQSRTFEVYNGDTMVSRLALVSACLAIAVAYAVFAVVSLLRAVVAMRRGGTVAVAGPSPSLRRRQRRRRRRERRRLRHREREQQRRVEETEEAARRWHRQHGRGSSANNSDSVYSRRDEDEDEDDYGGDFGSSSGSDDGGDDGGDAGNAILRSSSSYSSAQTISSLLFTMLNFGALLTAATVVVFVCSAGFFFHWFALSRGLPIDELVNVTAGANKADLLRLNDSHLARLHAVRQAYCGFLRCAGIASLLVSLGLLRHVASRLSYPRVFIAALRRAWCGLLAVAIVCLVVLGFGTAFVGHLAFGSSVMSMRRLRPEAYYAVLRAVGGWPLSAEDSNGGQGPSGASPAGGNPLTAGTSLWQQDHYLAAAFLFVVVLRLLYGLYLIALLLAVLAESYATVAASATIVPLRMDVAKLCDSLRYYLGAGALRRRWWHYRRGQERRRQLAREAALRRDRRRERAAARSRKEDQERERRRRRSTDGRRHSGIAHRQAVDYRSEYTSNSTIHSSSDHSSSDDDDSSSGGDHVGGFFIERSLAKVMLRRLLQLEDGGDTNTSSSNSSSEGGSDLDERGNATGAHYRDQQGHRGERSLSLSSSVGRSGGRASHANDNTTTTTNAVAAGNGSREGQHHQQRPSTPPPPLLLRQSDLLLLLPEADRAACRPEAGRLWGDIAWAYHCAGAPGGRLRETLLLWGAGDAVAAASGGGRGAGAATTAAAATASAPRVSTSASASVVLGDGGGRHASRRCSTTNHNVINSRNGGMNPLVAAAPYGVRGAEEEILAEVEAALRLRLGSALAAAGRVQRRLEVEEARVRPLLDFFRMVLRQLHKIAREAAAAAEADAELAAAEDAAAAAAAAEVSRGEAG